MRHRLRNILIVIVLLLATVFLLQKIKWLPSFSSIFGAKPIRIENTPILIKEIKNIAQLFTLTAYSETAVDGIRQGTSLLSPMLRSSPFPIPDFKTPDARIIIIGKGAVMAGIDLQKLKDSSVWVRGDSVSVRLPAPQVLQVIINPSDIEIFDQNGTWTDTEVQQIKNRLKDKLLQDALQQNFLQKAGENARAVMSNFLLSCGFKKVHVTSEN